MHRKYWLLSELCLKIYHRNRIILIIVFSLSLLKMFLLIRTLFANLVNYLLLALNGKIM